MNKNVCASVIVVTRPIGVGCHDWLEREGAGDKYGEEELELVGELVGE